jgi:hypothetical protein
MRKLLLLLFVLVVCSPLQLLAQKRDMTLTVKVTASTGENLEGQSVDVEQTDYSLNYGALSLDAQDQCQVKVYAGHHTVSVTRRGYTTATAAFNVSKDTTVSLVLNVQTTTPFALTPTVTHDAMTGKNAINMTWNMEKPVFEDGFESYDAFATTFGEWTGIDGDKLAAAPLVGSYPNRGVMQYAQIINPLSVDPTWWYSYPVLRPYEGNQYVGFTRTNSGAANDDWLISPAITVGTENVLSFYAKAADAAPERFQVYITENTASPQPSDFQRLDGGNYEQVDYKQWHLMKYSLAAYAGKTIKFAIRYISEHNTMGTFMLMVDNVRVGQDANSPSGKAKAAGRRSPRNPLESFDIFLDGTKVATTDSYGYTIADISTGRHTVGVQAVYPDSRSEMTSDTVDVPSDYARTVFHVTADSKRTADGEKLNLVNTATGETLDITVDGDTAVVPSLPYATYVANIAEGAFNAFTQTYTVQGPATYDITLTDKVRDPYNITADITPNGTGGSKVTLKWNQDLAFADSFEDYPDFATGSFGQWTSLDLDGHAVYPISLNGSLISFPGSGTQQSPTAIAPIVFNPYTTVPAMMPTDQAMKPVSGNKEILFFSPQQYTADKWLISPQLDIRDGYELSVVAKSYSEMYPEQLEFAVSTTGAEPANFTVVSKAENMPAEQWTEYVTDLSAYAGKTVRIGVHYYTTDGFFAQMDDFKVGPAGGEERYIDYGNVVRYDITLDDMLVAQSDTPTCVLPDVTAGNHVIGITAVYKNATSATTKYSIVVTSVGRAVLTGSSDKAPEYYNLQGQMINNLEGHGVVIVKQGNTIKKLMR